MKEYKSENKLQCENCKIEIDYGKDVISTEKCVNGPRGLIPLDEILTFCSDSCVSAYFDHEPTSGLPKVMRRIP